MFFYEGRIDFDCFVLGYVVFLRVIKHIYFPDEINTKYVVIVSLMIISLQCDLKIEFVFLKNSEKIAKSFFLVLRLGEQSRFYCQFCHISITIHCSLTYNHSVEHGKRRLHCPNKSYCHCGTNNTLKPPPNVGTLNIWPHTKVNLVVYTTVLGTFSNDRALSDGCVIFDVCYFGFTVYAVC